MSTRPDPGRSSRNYAPAVERPAASDDLEAGTPGSGGRGPGFARRPRHRPGHEGPSGPARSGAGPRLRGDRFKDHRAEYAGEIDPCPEGTTGTTPPDCTPIPDPVVGNAKLTGKGKAKGKKITVKVTCSASADSCRKAKVVLKAKGRTLAKGKNIKTKPGKKKTVKLKMTGKGRKLFKKKGSRKQKKKLKAKVLVNGSKSGKITVKRTGKIK